ncbi:MAG TPA: hypothetical protein VGY77_07335, partial [Gemmataceae bacterium]|nr:hypothetical protein [Gemmataceae bacterium]
MRVVWSIVVLVFNLSWIPSTFAGSSNSLMDVSPDGKWLLVTNADNGSVSVVDTDARKSLREIQVGEKPEGVTWIANGPLAAVTVYREDVLVVFNAHEGKVLRKVKVAAEPYGIVANRAGTRAWVTHEYPGTVTEIDLEKFTITREINGGRFLRGLALDPDEKRLYLTEFYTANLIALDLSTGKVVDTWPGQAPDNLCRHVVLHPTRPKAYLSHIRSKVEVIQGTGSIFPHVSICDIEAIGLTPGNLEKKRRKSIAMDSYNNVYVVTNPWEAALSPDGKRIYTIYAGTNDMNISRVVDDDYKEMERIISPVTVGKNPRAVRVSPDGQTVFISNTLDFSVSVHKAANMEKLADIPVCNPPKTPAWVQGKIFFNTALYPMTSQRWIACSSCHPDGHTDGRVWNNPEGLRKTTALFGMAHT